MTTITIPANFRSLDLFNEAISKFEEQAKEICRTHNAMSLWNAIKWDKDEKALSYAIISMGAWPAHSDEYRAQNKILGLWDEMFGINGFF